MSREIVDKEHNRVMSLLRVEVVRWLSAEPFPGWVEARLVDVHGQEWLFHDKPPVFCGELLADDALPADGTVACRVIGVHAAGRTVVSVDTDVPGGVAATDGTARFEISTEQLVVDGRSGRDRDTSAALCPRCAGTGVNHGALRKKHNSPRIARAHFDVPPCPDCLGAGELGQSISGDRFDHRRDDDAQSPRRR